MTGTGFDSNQGSEWVYANKILFNLDRNANSADGITVPGEASRIIEGTAVHYCSPTKVLFDLPADANSGTYTFYNEFGYSNSVTINITGTGGQPTVDAACSGYSAATITDLFPDSGPVGTWVVIRGAGFGTTNTVKFNGVAATVIYSFTPTEVMAKVPAGATTGNVTLAVAGSTAAVNGPVFTVSNTAAANETTCKNITGYASNCEGTNKVVAATASAVAGSNTEQVAIAVNKPANTTHVIYNKAYYYAASGNWTELALTGTPYNNDQPVMWLKDSAVGAVSIPKTNLAVGTNYIVAWEYTWNGQCWVGPAGACETGKWRVETFNVQ